MELVNFPPHRIRLQPQRKNTRWRPQDAQRMRDARPRCPKLLIDWYAKLRTVLHPLQLQRTCLPPQLVFPPNSKNVLRQQYKHLVYLFFFSLKTRTFFEPDFAASRPSVCFTLGVFSFVAPFSLAAPLCRKFVPTLRPSDGESFYVSHPFSFVSHFLSIHMFIYTCMYRSIYIY